MLYLDNITLEKKLKGLEQGINTSRAGETIYIESNTIKRKNSIYLLENKLKTKENKRQIGKPFYLVFFVSSLESELNKINPSEDICIEDKISIFVEKTEIQNTFSLLFN